MLVHGTPGLDVIHLSQNGAADCHADVVLTPMRGEVALSEVLTKCRGLRWVHVLGTGVDSFPFELVGDRVITCSLGATAVPTAE